MNNTIKKGVSAYVTLGVQMIIRDVFIFMIPTGLFEFSKISMGTGTWIRIDRSEYAFAI